MVLCCMNRPLDYSCFMMILFTWLEQLDFNIRFYHFYWKTSARVFLGWKNVKILLVARPRHRASFSVGVDAFWWSELHGHCFLLIPAPLVFSSYSSLEYDKSNEISLSCSLDKICRVYFPSGLIYGVSQRPHLLRNLTSFLSTTRSSAAFARTKWCNESAGVLNIVCWTECSAA